MAILVLTQSEVEQLLDMKQPLKMPACEEIVQKAGVSDSAVAYIGDDLPDIPVMRRAGLAVCGGRRGSGS